MNHGCRERSDDLHTVCLRMWMAIANFNPYPTVKDMLLQEGLVVSVCHVCVVLGCVSAIDAKVKHITECCRWGNMAHAK